MVLATPLEWQNYEVRYVYAHPAEGVPEAVHMLDERAAFEASVQKSHYWEGIRENLFDRLPSGEYAVVGIERHRQTWLAALAVTLPTAQGLDAASVARHLAIGRAIERVCVELPEGAEISISLEKGAGTITLIDWDGNEQENFPTDDGFAGTLNAAVDTAIADAAAIAAQAKQGGA